jgi:hypothetical protein
MGDTSELVVVSAFSQPHEAHLARSVLSAASLEACVADDNTVAADWLMSNAIGGVKVLVRADDLTIAREVLDTTALAPDDEAPGQVSDAEDSREDVCPHCGSRALSAITHGLRLAAFTWMVVGIPLFPVWRRRRCGDCGQESR